MRILKVSSFVYRTFSANLPPRLKVSFLRICPSVLEETHELHQRGAMVAPAKTCLVEPSGPLTIPTPSHPRQSACPQHPRPNRLDRSTALVSEPCERETRNDNEKEIRQEYGNTSTRRRASGLHEDAVRASSLTTRAKIFRRCASEHSRCLTSRGCIESR